MNENELLDFNPTAPVQPAATAPAEEPVAPQEAAPAASAADEALLNEPDLASAASVDSTPAAPVAPMTQEEPASAAPAYTAPVVPVAPAYTAPVTPDYATPNAPVTPGYATPNAQSYRAADYTALQGYAPNNAAPYGGYQQQMPNQPYGVPQPGYGYPVAQPASGAAMASMILGIVSLVFCLFGEGAFVSVITGIVGIVQASNAKKAGNTSAQRTAGFVMSLIGLILGSLVFVSCAAFMAVL